MGKGSRSRRKKKREQKREVKRQSIKNIRKHTSKHDINLSELDIFPLGNSLPEHINFVVK